VADPKAIAFPDGRFAAALFARDSVISVGRSHDRLAMVAGNTPDIAFKKPVSKATGFVQIDLADQSISFVPLPGNGQLDASPAAGAGEVNNYVYGINTDSSRLGSPIPCSFSTEWARLLFDLTCRRAFPGFRACRRRPNGVCSSGRRKTAWPVTPGWSYSIWRISGEVHPDTDRVYDYQFLGVFPATRKARRPGASTQPTQARSFLIYDLLSGRSDDHSEPGRSGFGRTDSSGGSRPWPWRWLARAPIRARWRREQPGAPGSRSGPCAGADLGAQSEANTVACCGWTDRASRWVSSSVRNSVSAAVQ